MSDQTNKTEATNRTEPRKPATTANILIRVPKSDAFMQAGADAIRELSLSRGRFVTLRVAIIEGIERLIDDDKMKVLILIKQYDRVKYVGDATYNVTFSSDEIRLMRECKARIQAVTLQKIKQYELIFLALMRLQTDARATDNAGR